MFEILGENDELSSRIGMLYSLMIIPDDILLLLEKQKKFLKKTQQTLQDINSILATENEKKREKLRKISIEDVKEIEDNIDEIDKELACLTKFILPGETQIDSQAHLCRTQTRRVERMLWKYYNMVVYSKEESNYKEMYLYINKYTNRLSDYFFTLARYVLE